MEWSKLICIQRLGCPKPRRNDTLGRTEFQRDFDRIVFSSAFRRLQGKTQVIPLPETDIIHTRLTHSLEASCVGRSLGMLVGNFLEKDHHVRPWELSAIVSAASLMHDIGNPPFGHSGEDAISHYFSSKSGEEYLNGLSEEQKSDFTLFEGNALGFRMLCHSNPAILKVKGGIALTYSTLGAFTKYPRPSLLNGHNSSPDNVALKKHSFFTSEQDYFSLIATEMGLPKVGNMNAWARHPLAFLVEAADDICYRIVDLEDGYKHNLVSYDTISDLFQGVINSSKSDTETGNIGNILNECNIVGYLRSKAINSLINQCVKAFEDNHDLILAGKYEKSLMSDIPAASYLKEIKEVSIKKIYGYRPVLQVEAAGFEVLPGLLSVFLPSLLKKKKTDYDKKVLSLIPSEYQKEPKENLFEAIMNIVQYVACMTDTFAIDTYRILSGSHLPNY